MLAAGALWPSGARHIHFHGKHLALPGPAHPLGAAPFIDGHEQRSPIRAAKHTGEAAAVEIDHLQHFTALDRKSTRLNSSHH